MNSGSRFLCPSARGYAKHSLPLAMWLLVTLHSLVADGQRIERIMPRAVQLRGTTQVLVETSGLRIEPDADRVALLFGDVLIEATLISRSENKLRLSVALDPPAANPPAADPPAANPPAADHANASLLPGIYPLRLVDSKFVTNPVLVAVDELRQVDLADFDDTRVVTELPIALHGELLGDAIHETAFLGHAGQRIVVDVEGRRLGSQLRPVIRLYSPSGRQLALARPTRQLAGDARLGDVLPETGIYRVQLQDIVYKGPTPGWFRLKLGELKSIDAVFPLAVSAAGRHTLELLYGDEVKLVAYDAGEMSRVGPIPVSRFAASHLSEADRRTFFQNLTGVMPRVRTTAWGDRERMEPADKSAPFNPPIALNGRLSARGEVDQYAVRVSPGSNLQIDLFADRWGSPLDAVIDVLDENGKSLGRGDDQPGTTDPRLEVTVPDSCQQMTVRVSSLTGQSGPRQSYRLAIRTTQPPSSTLVLPHASINLPAGSRWVGQLTVDHAGRPKPIQLRLGDHVNPIGLRVEPARLLAEDEQPLIGLFAPRLARGVFLIRIDATSDESERTIIQTPQLANQKQQPDLAEQHVVMVGDPAPIDVIWVDDLDPLVRGSQRPTRVQIIRNSQAANSLGPVRLSLLTSQTPRMRNENEQQVVDEARTLRLVEIAPTSSTELDAKATVYVPNDLPEHPWSLAMKAELLSDDQSSVRATVFSEIRQLNTISAIRFAYEPPKSLEVVAGTPTVIRGSIVRDVSFRHPVIVRFEGLEDKVSASTVVDVDEEGFQLALLFPQDEAARTFDSVRLVATPQGGPHELATVKALSTTFTVELTASK